jgi:hypothetical protein
VSSRARPDALIALDSFLDVMTNAVGIMILVAIVVVVHSGTLSVTLGTPVLRDPAAGAERRVVHCAANRVAFLDEAQLRRRAWDALERECEARGGPLASAEEVEQVFAQRDVGTATHRVHYIDSATSVFAPRKGAGEKSSELRAPDSRFRARLAALDPAKDWLFFVVETDSFGAFRVARRLARDRGFDVGWYPHASGEPIAVSAAGSIGEHAQ